MLPIKKVSPYYDGELPLELTKDEKRLYQRTASILKKSERRLFMARTVRVFGADGQQLAKRELGWDSKTIRKGIRELESGITCQDASSFRGRKLAEETLPNLLLDIKAIVNGQSQIDPSFQTSRLYSRLSAAEVRRQLIAQKGYRDEELPTERTISTKLNRLGYRLRTVTKSKVKKKSLKQTQSSRKCSK